MLKDLLGGTIQTMLEAEIEDNLGYSEHNCKEKIYFLIDHRLYNILRQI